MSYGFLLLSGTAIINKLFVLKNTGDQEKYVIEKFLNKLTRIIQLTRSQVIYRVDYKLPYKL